MRTHGSLSLEKAREIIAAASCPKCRAAVGEACKSLTTGNPVHRPHEKRVMEALRRGAAL